MSGIEFWIPLALISLSSLLVAITGVAFLLHRSLAPMNVVPTASAVVDEIIEAYGRSSTQTRTSVGEREFAAMVLFWLNPCLDTTFYALAALRRLLAREDPARAEDLIVGMRDRLTQMLRTHFDDDDAGAFKHHPHSWPTLYASVVAVRMCKWCADPRSFAELDGDGGIPYPDAIQECLGSSDALTKLKQFLTRCELEQGGFGEFPGAQPGTVTTDAGYRVFALLGIQPRYPEATANFIRSCQKDAPDYDAGSPPFGFANRPDDKLPTCSATRHATRALEDNPALRERRGLDNEERLRVCDFLKLLKTGDGGFAWTKGGSSSVVQTGLAFQTLELLVKHPGTGTYEDVVPYEAISHYLGLLASGSHRLGFGSSSPDNICAVREAVRLTDMTETVYAKGVNGLGASFRVKLLQAVCDHFDERSGLFVGYTQDGHKSIRGVAKYLGRSILDLSQPSLAATS